MTTMIIGGVIGPKEIILIVLAILLLFGGKKIPELMRGIGEGIKEFKKSSRLDDDSQNKEKETQKSDTKE
jgi:sec-independent protein translocase protein TatA